MRVSRRRLAAYTAEQLVAGNTAVVRQLAALIVAERREREIDLLVRDIETELAERGVLIATIETAEELTDSLRQAVTKFLGGNVSLREVVRQELIGGLRIEIPTMRLDETVAKKLQTLKSLSAKDI